MAAQLSFGNLVPSLGGSSYKSMDQAISETGMGSTYKSMDSVVGPFQAANPYRPSRSKIESGLPFSLGEVINNIGSSVNNTLGRNPGSTGAAGGRASGLTDGHAGFVNMLSGFATAAIEGIGARVEPTAATVQPVAWGGSRPSTGMDNSTLMIVGLVGVGVYLAMKA